MINITDLRNDREAGTSGPYSVTTDHEWSLETGGSNAYYVIQSGNGVPFAIVAVEDAWAFDKINEADMRRVKRLDTMEQALLDWSDAMNEVRQAMDGCDAEVAVSIVERVYCKHFAGDEK